MFHVEASHLVLKKHGKDRDDNTGKRAACDKSCGKQTSSPKLTLFNVSPLLLHGPIGDTLDRSTDPNRQRRRKGQVRADGERERLHAAQFHRDGEKRADKHKLPIEIERQQTLDKGCHECALRRGELVCADHVLNTRSCRFLRRRIENLHRRADDDCGGDRADE